MLGAGIDAARAHLRHWNNSVAQNVAELKQPDVARRDAFDYMNGMGKKRELRSHWQRVWWLRDQSRSRLSLEGSTHA
jgi:hypothetical protein